MTAVSILRLVLVWVSGMDWGLVVGPDGARVTKCDERTLGYAIKQRLG